MARAARNGHSLSAYARLYDHEGLENRASSRLNPCVPVPTDFEKFDAMVDLAFQKALNSPIPLSWEMTWLLYSVMFDDYELFPAKRDDTRSGNNPG